MSIPNGKHVVDGLHFEKAPNQRWPYTVTRVHTHHWRTKPRPGRNATRTVKDKDKDGADVATFSHSLDAVTLLPSYSWDGSTGAIDVLSCARASALHDIWCQAMDSEIFESSWRNWRRGAIEYREICGTDGMNRARRWGRYLTMTYAYGTWKKLKRKLGSAGRQPARRSG